jgi:hypothetical protein
MYSSYLLLLLMPFASSFPSLLNFQLPHAFYVSSLMMTLLTGNNFHLAVLVVAVWLVLLMMIFFETNVCLVQLLFHLAVVLWLLLKLMIFFMLIWLYSN